MEQLSAMIGVALEESPTLKIHHLTHDITPYNIFEGELPSLSDSRLLAEGTTFVRWSILVLVPNERVS